MAPDEVLSRASQRTKKSHLDEDYYASLAEYVEAAAVASQVRSLASLAIQAGLDPANYIRSHVPGWDNDNILVTNLTTRASCINSRINNNPGSRNSVILLIDITRRTRRLAKIQEAKVATASFLAFSYHRRRKRNKRHRKRRKLGSLPNRCSTKSETSQEGPGSVDYHQGRLDSHKPRAPSPTPPYAAVENTGIPRPHDSALPAAIQSHKASSVNVKSTDAPQLTLPCDPYRHHRRRPWRSSVSPPPLRPVEPDSNDHDNSALSTLLPDQPSTTGPRLFSRPPPPPMSAHPTRASPRAFPAPQSAFMLTQSASLGAGQSRAPPSMLITQTPSISLGHFLAPLTPLFGNQPTRLYSVHILAPSPALMASQHQQLQPVKAQAPYIPVLGDVFGTDVRMSVDVWSQFRVSFLSQSMRAAADPAFAATLDHISLGNANAAVLQFLDSRRIFRDLDGSQPLPLPQHPRFKEQALPPSIPKWRAEDYWEEHELEEKAVEWIMAKEASTPGLNLTVIVPTVKQCQSIAAVSSILRNIQTAQDMMISGWSKSKGGQAKKKALLEGMKVADTGGLESKLVLGVGSRVMVRKNIEPENGIVNGALGHVTALRRSVDGASIQTVVVHLWATDKDAEISRTTATFQPHKTSATLYERTQFPLSPADAITVHKAQGLTLDAILVDLGPAAAVDNLAYVALSRATAADRVFVLRLHPGVIRTDAISIQVLNQHRGEEGLPQQSVWNDLDPRYAGARELAFSSWRRRPSILPSHAYANAPTPQSAPAKRKAGGKTPAQAVRAVHGHGTPGRSRSKSARGRPKSARAKTQPPRGGQRNGATPQRPPRPPVQRQVRFRSPQPQPGAPQLDPDASLLPENLRLDAQWLIDHFTQTTAISAQNHMTTVIALQAHLATGECRAKLDALLVWLRQLEPITSQDTPQPLPQDLLNPTSFLYTCLRPLLTTVRTPADGDCLYHALWGAFRGDSSDWLVLLLRALVVGTVLRHWDFFLAVEAVANGLTPDEVLPTFCADLCDAVAAKEWALDSMLIIASYIFAREIHLYKRCYVNYEPINGQANDQSLAALQQSILASESIHILSYSLVPVPGARRPLYVIFNNANHYSTLFPTSPAAVAQLPTPLPYRGQIQDPITALLQHHQVPGVNFANLGPSLSLLPPPLQPPMAPPRKPGPGRKGPAQPPLARLPVAKKNPLPKARKPLPVPLNTIPDWTAWAKSNNLSNTPNPPVPYNAGINGQLRIYRGDILTIQVDCITNAANSGLQGGGGIDGTIHAAAGPAMAAYNKKMYRKGCPVGSARSSPGFNLTAKHVIHAVGPDYNILGGTSAGLSSAAALLDSAYSTALAEAARLGATSVALPCISIGIYKFPEAQAAAIAAAAVRRFLHSQQQNPKMTVVLALWSQQNEMDYARALPLQFPFK